MFFRCVFHLENIGFAETNVKKKSVVSVWYAQNSLPFCTEACYTTLTGCEDPTKMLIRVCILLQMQPAPLTGTATDLIPRKRARSWGCSPHPSRGQQLLVPLLLVGNPGCSPHPSRGQQPFSACNRSQNHSYRCSPHPSRGQQQMRRRCHSFQMDAARAPHGDNNILVTALFTMSGVMQPVPLTGTTTFLCHFCSPYIILDAARTPHGDSNHLVSAHACTPSRCSPCPSRGQQLVAFKVPYLHIVMQPAPLTGTKKRETRNSSVSCLPFYISACSLTSLFHIAEEGYAGILCHSPCAAGFRCVLRGRRQLVYILSLYLSYVKFILRHSLSYDKMHNKTAAPNGKLGRRFCYARLLRYSSTF